MADAGDEAPLCALFLDSFPSSGAAAHGDLMALCALAAEDYDEAETAATDDVPTVPAPAAPAALFPFEAACAAVVQPPGRSPSMLRAAQRELRHSPYRRRSEAARRFALAAGEMHIRMAMMKPFAAGR